MKKVFLFLLASVAMVSCGSDDGDGGSKRPSSVVISGGGQSYSYNMSYGEKGRLSTMTSSYGGAHTIAFSYNDKGKVSTAIMTGGVSENFSFTYDADGKMTSYTNGSGTTTVTWANPTTVTVGSTTLNLDNKGDVLFYDSLTFAYENKKGAFANVKGIDALTLLILDLPTIYFGSKKPIATISGSGTSYIMSNTFSGGMLSQATFSSGSDTFNINVTY